VAVVFTTTLRTYNIVRVGLDHCMKQVAVVFTPDLKDLQYSKGWTGPLHETGGCGIYS
jgi:hypothetical protein